MLRPHYPQSPTFPNHNSIHEIPTSFRWRTLAGKAEASVENLAKLNKEEEVIEDDALRPGGSLLGRTSEAGQTRQFVALVTSLMIVGIIFSVITMFLVTNMGFKFSVIKVLRKFFKSGIARQVIAIIGLMLFVRYGLTPVIRGVRDLLGRRTAWENSIENYLLKELYSPLELLLVVAALGALAESILPPLISVQKGAVEFVARSTVSITFVVATAKVVHNIKERIFSRAKWNMEVSGKMTEQHRLDAIDKLLTVAIVIVASILGLQALGLDVNSVLAIGGVGGLAIGLAGREIFENLFSGLLLMGSRPFEVGDEVVLFSTEQNKVEGIILDVGWYRTLVRDFQREVYIIPNSLFSRSVVRNVTRKGREWRFFEHILIRPNDIDKVEKVISDMRRVIRQDSRVIQKLHKRAFLDEINREYISIYISFYLEAPTRDAYMAARQQLFFEFVNCVLRSNAEIAQRKLLVEGLPTNVLQAEDFEEELEDLDMTDADAATESETGHQNFNGEMSTHVNVSSMIENLPVEDSSSLTRSGKRKRDASSG